MGDLVEGMNTDCGSSFVTSTTKISMHIKYRMFNQTSVVHKLISFRALYRPYSKYIYANDNPKTRDTARAIREHIMIPIRRSGASEISITNFVNETIYNASKDKEHPFIFYHNDWEFDS
jgi:hypothetical protein